MTDNNRKMLEMYKKLWSKIKKQIKCNSIEAINTCKCNFTESVKYEKDPIKSRFDLYDDNLPLDKMLRFFDLNIMLESVFQIKDKSHPRIHIHESEYKEYE